MTPQPPPEISPATTMVEDRTDDADGPRRRWVRWVLVTVCLALAAMWVYAFLFAPSKGVYRVDDANWRAQAEKICTASNAERLALADTSGGFIADPTPAQMRQHAAVVDRATDILERMLNDVVAVPVPTDRDRLLIATFDKYYRTIIADRRTYTAALDAGRLVSYEETSVGGGPVTNVITDFTSGNDIKACVPPGELGSTL